MLHVKSLRNIIITLKLKKRINLFTVKFKVYRESVAKCDNRVMTCGMAIGFQLCKEQITLPYVTRFSQ